MHRRRAPDEASSPMNKSPAVAIDCLSMATSDNSDLAKSNDPLQFNSTKMRTLLKTSSLILLLLSSTSILSGSRPPSSVVKELTDNVTSLTRQLILGDTLRELDALKHELDNREVELSWEHQHTGELEEKETLMLDSFIKSHTAKTEALHDYQNTISKIALSNRKIEAELHKEQLENDHLKDALKKALEELAEMRKKQEYKELMETQAKLRGSPNIQSEHELTYQAGDSIEVFEYKDGKTAVMPGVVSGVTKSDNHPVTYDVVTFHEAKHFKFSTQDPFRKYEIYPPGSQAYYTIGENAFPVTIIRFLSQERDGLEVHGKYEVYSSNDHAQLTHEVYAARIFRYVENDF